MPLSRLNGTSALKLLSIVIGATVYGLGVYSYDETNLQEEYFIRSIQGFLIISIIYFCVILFSEKMSTSEFNKAIDIVFHISGAIVLLIVAGLLIYTAVDNERTYCDILHIKYPESFCQFYKEKLAAGVITVMNGTVYAMIAVVIFMTHLKGNDNKDKVTYKTTATFLDRDMPKSFYFGANGSHK